jgi:hypothetical protein
VKSAPKREVIPQRGEDSLFAPSFFPFIQRIVCSPSRDRMKGTSSPLGDKFTPGGQVRPWGTSSPPGGQVRPRGTSSPPGDKFAPGGQVRPRGTSSPLGNKFIPGGQVHPGGKFIPGDKFAPGGQVLPWGTSSPLGQTHIGKNRPDAAHIFRRLSLRPASPLQTSNRPTVGFKIEAFGHRMRHSFAPTSDGKTFPCFSSSRKKN